MLWNALFLIVERKPPLDKSQQIKEGYLGPGSQINCPVTSICLHGVNLGYWAASNGPSLVDSHFDSGNFFPPLPFHRSMAKSFSSETVIYMSQFRV